MRHKRPLRATDMSLRAVVQNENEQTPNMFWPIFYNCGKRFVKISILKSLLCVVTVLA